MSEELIEQQEEQYSASNIQVLEGLEAVRKRPSMYIGDTHVKGLHHLVSEVVDNSIDEALAGFCDKVTVTIGEDNSITVSDNGRGIPVDEHEKLHKSALEVVMTVLHAGGKFDKGSYKVSGGLHGVGVSCVNALSDYLRAEVRREGKVYMQEYAFGKPTIEVKIIGECAEEDHGTTVIFHPDATIFQTTVYQFSILSNRLRDLAYLNAGVTLSLTDLRDKDEHGVPRTEVYHSETGLDDFVRYLDEGKEPLISDVIHITNNEGEIPVEVAMTYNKTFKENIYSFVNNINTIEGGTHLQGFRMGLGTSLKKYAEKSKALEKAKVEPAAQAELIFASVNADTQLFDRPGGSALYDLKTGVTLSIEGKITVDETEFAYVTVLGSTATGYVPTQALTVIPQEDAEAGIYAEGVIALDADVQGKKPVFTIVMNDGSVMYGELYPDIAPESVGNFIALANADFYSGVIFHRVISGFMIQGGDPTGTGTGGPGYAIKGEFTSNGVENGLSHVRGVLSMARSSEMDSAGSQFFICHADSTFLDGEYAGFGMLLGGFDTLDAIAAVRTSSDRPVTDQIMKLVHVETYGAEYAFTKIED